mmetsp:Transcript_46330/g.142925  ORF Transcript_46330/g.142925 Transcript_46330/m.142925 type:complete len:153 (-) Transcript_46330:87-545(-)
MLSRTAPRAMLRRTQPAGYRYQEFEYSKTAALAFFYPREAPNTSYFPQWQIGFWVFWGWGREELWIDRDERRYQTMWQLGRKLIMVMFPTMYFFPIGAPRQWAESQYGTYGEKSYLAELTRMPFDNQYLETHGAGYPLDAEWLRHIHSQDSF